MELTSCSPLHQGEKRIGSSLGLCLDFEEKVSGVSLDDGVWASWSSAARAQAQPGRPVNSVPCPQL
jgi:hypothetical protein